MMMKKNLFLAALAIVAFASCTDSEFVGDNSPDNTPTANEKAINFGFDMQRVTRADIAGPAAATLLGNNFYVTGTKGNEAGKHPTEDIVFNNYLVHYDANTAATTESNTANWEYVNVNPTTVPNPNTTADDYYIKLSSLNAQTIKYWDYSNSQYDFMAFSTGTYTPVLYSGGTSTASEDNKTIGVTAMLYGEALDVTSSTPTAYTFHLPSVNALKNAYITDITEVVKDNYGKEVTLKFKNLGSKVRVALYETVPGYSVKDVVFYQWDGTTDFTAGAEKVKGSTAALISANATGIPTSGTIQVCFPHVGNDNASQQDYNKATANVSAGSTSEKAPTFGTLHNLVTKELYEEASPVYLGRSTSTATFAGSAAADYYTTVFPVSSPDPLTLRVDYKLVSTDGSGEVIQINGAKAVVPSTYTKWLPNYAYTYIFKISDNTNGWTDPTGADPAGLFPITFDAVVTEATDATAQQTTITTVATPTITTYQQNHAYTSATEPNEYSKAVGKNVYVQVMDNTLTTPRLVGTGTGEGASTLPKLNVTTPYTTSLLYKVDDTHASTVTEAEVMDALEKRTATDGSGNITGRNTVVLTKSTINNSVTSIVNGVDNNPITVAEGEAAMITITGDGALSAGTYAYVYDYTPASPGKTETTLYQPIAVTNGNAIATSGTYYSITTTTLNGIAYDSNKTGANEAVDKDYIYFTKTTTDGGTTYTYSFVSVDGKTILPAGLLKVLVSSSLTPDVAASTVAIDGTFYFDKYIRNNGNYAVKVIKVVN